MIPKCWLIIFLLPVLVFAMPSSLLTARSSQTAAPVEGDSKSNPPELRNNVPQDKAEQPVVMHGQHTGSGAVSRPHQEGHLVPGTADVVHLIPHPPGVNAAQPTTQPAEIDQISISSADFLCYNDKTSVLIPDVPCPAESSQKTAITTQLLNLILKSQSGAILIPGVSLVAPPDLHGYNLSDIGSADWMNYNKSDLSVRLQVLLQQLQQNKTQLLDHLLQYTSSNSLRSITSLTNLLLDVLNSTSLFNMCENDTGVYFTNNENDTSANFTNNELSCNDLQAGIQTLNYLNFEVQKLLASEEYSNVSSQIINNTTGTTLNGSLGSDANMDVIIDDLIQRLRGTKADSKVLAELYTHLLLALNDFKAVVIKLMKKFLVILLESDFFETSDRLSSIMFDIDIALGGDVDIDRFGSLASQTTTSEFTTQTPSVDSSIADKIVGLNLTTRDDLIETTVDPLRELKIRLQEASQEHYLFNHSLLLELIQWNTNVTNATLEAVRYYEVIIEVAVTLISSLTELSQLLNGGEGPEFEHDEVLENMTSWHNLRSRTKRDVAGYIISSDRCQRQGNMINQTNFISLCSSCLHTTVLDNTYYPRYLTEKICTSGSSSIPAFRDGCLFQPGLLGGRPGGLCKQQEFYILLLRQIPGKCMKVVSQGQQIITDQWQSTTHALRIGCECVVDQNSQFAKYTHFP